MSTMDRTLIWIHLGLSRVAPIEATSYSPVLDIDGTADVRLDPLFAWHGLVDRTLKLALPDRSPMKKHAGYLD